MATERGATTLPGWLRRLGSRSEPAADGNGASSQDLLTNFDVIVCDVAAPAFGAVAVSAAMIDQYGWDAGLWVSGEVWRHLVRSEDAERVVSRLRSVAEGNGDRKVEFRGRSADGRERVVRLVARQVVNGARTTVRVVMQDVTVVRQAESASREGDERSRALLDHAADALFVHDEEGRFVEVNRTGCELLGYNRDELLGLRMADVLVDYEETTAKATWSGLATGGTVRADGELRRRDGTTFPAEVRTGLFPWGGRSLIVTIARDTSAVKRLEQQLRHSQKMEAVGRLAGGVAHDFNNLLTAIKGHADLLIQELAAQGQVRADLSEITRAADRAATLTRKLLAFSRQQIFAPEILDLNRIVEDTSRLLRPLIGEHIDFRVELDATGHVRTDHGQIEQVLVNLVVNARDAMPTGGTLTIATSEVVVDAAHPFSHGFVRPGRYIVLRVSDTGHGMDAATMARIFEPFFTTKEKGRGSGLGLAIAYGIVKQSGGYLIAESEAGRGATFLVILPRAEPGTAILTATSGLLPAQTRPATGRTVLVVEDEAPVRALVARVLTREGFRVLEAETGEQALRRAGEATSLDLVLADVVLPDMDGRDVARTLATSRPGLRIVLMSGYSDELPHSGAAELDAPRLHKPFTPAELASRIRETLAI